MDYVVPRAKIIKPMSSSLWQVLGFRFILEAFAALMMLSLPFLSTSFAADLTATYQVPLTNITCSVDDTPGFLLSITVGGNFYVPLIDSSKFTITGVTIGLNGSLGGADWQSSVPPAALFSEISWTMSFNFLGSTNFSFWGESIDNQAGFASSYCVWDEFLNSDTDVDPSIPITSYYIGGPRDQNGYIAFPVTVNVENTGYIRLPGEAYDPCGQLDFVANFVLTVAYQLTTVSPTVTSSNLPPTVAVAPSLTIIQDNSAFPVPVSANANLPTYILQAVGLYVTGIQRQTNDIKIAWNTIGGSTNYVQASPTLVNPNFTNISGPIVIQGSNMVSTNFVVQGGAINGGNMFYRISLAP